MFTAPFCGICRQLKKKVPQMAVDHEWQNIEFGLCSVDVVPELKHTLKISGYPFWYIYHGKFFYNVSTSVT